MLKEQTYDKLADAILDRLVNNSHKLNLKGGSMRMNRLRRKLNLDLFDGI